MSDAIASILQLVSTVALAAAVAVVGWRVDIANERIDMLELRIEHLEGP